MDSIACTTGKCGQPIIEECYLIIMVRLIQFRLVQRTNQPSLTSGHPFPNLRSRRARKQAK